MHNTYLSTFQTLGKIEKLMLSRTEYKFTETAENKNSVRIKRRRPTRGIYFSLLTFSKRISDPFQSTSARKMRRIFLLQACGARDSPSSPVNYFPRASATVYRIKWRTNFAMFVSTEGHVPCDTDGKLDIPVSEEAAATGSNNGDCVSLLTSSLSWLPRIFPFKDATFIESLIRYLFKVIYN